MKVLLYTGATNPLGGLSAIKILEHGVDLKYVFLKYRSSRRVGAKGLARGIRRDGLMFYAVKAMDYAAVVARPLQKLFNLGYKPVFPIEIAREYGIPITAMSDCNAPRAEAWLKGQKPDVLITAGFGQILGEQILSVPNLEAVNVHPSLLPAHPGSNPFREILRERVSISGVTIHRLTASVDAGEILQQKTYQVPRYASQYGLRLRAARLAADLAGEFVGDLVRSFSAQDGCGRA